MIQWMNRNSKYFHTISSWSSCRAMCSSHSDWETKNWQPGIGQGSDSSDVFSLELRKGDSSLIRLRFNSLDGAGGEEKCMFTWLSSCGAKNSMKHTGHAVPSMPGRKSQRSRAVTISTCLSRLPSIFFFCFSNNIFMVDSESSLD